jgi:hypothetical protein
MAVARNNRHNAAFVVGSVLGAVAGAAVALWKTPLTGEELRSKLTGAGSQQDTGTQAYRAPVSIGTSASARAGEERSLKDKVLSGVEKTLAPIVGVELGKTANGSGGTTLDSGEIKVSPEYGTTLLRHPHAWTDGNEASAASGSGDVKLGLSRDKVDAEKWAAAYGTSADTTATTPSTPVASTPPVEPVKTETASSEYGTTLLRHPHAWTDGGEAATTPDSGTEKLGLSLDKVDAEKWAAAYSGTEDTTMTTPAEGSFEQGSTDIGAADQGDARLRPKRSWGDTGETQDSSGISTSSTGGYASKAAESEAQTGLGAKPAYPDNDQTGHQPADPSAPESNVGEVRRRADNIRTDSGLTSEDAASVDSLTKPQTDRIPDSMRTPDEGSYHPFPDLGGKES